MATYGDFWRFVDVWRVVLLRLCIRGRFSSMERESSLGRAMPRTLGTVTWCNCGHPPFGCFKGCFGGCFDNVSDIDATSLFAVIHTEEQVKCIFGETMYHGRLDMLMLVIYLVIPRTTPLPAMPGSKS